MTLNSKLIGVLLVPLSAFVILKGILPGFTEIKTDFPNYYTAGNIARTGGNAGRLYDDGWFQQQIYKNGMSVPGKFSPFPPPTAILFIPLSYLSPLAAQQAFNTLNLFLLGCAILLLSRLFTMTRFESSAFVLLSGWGLANNFRFGQLYIALSLSILLGFYFQQRKKDIPAGISFGLLLPVKYFSVALLVQALLEKKWKVVITGTITTAFICLLSIWILGWPVHEEFFRSILGEHLQSRLSQQNPFSSNFQSFDSLFHRLFVFDARLNPHPLYASMNLFLTMKFLSISLAVAAAVYSILLHRNKDSKLQLSVLCLLALLIAPATATYHFVLLWLPVGILLQHFRRTDDKTLFWFTLAVYACIGFLPYSLFVKLDGSGILTLFAYPRLFLLLTLFILTVIQSGRKNCSVEECASHF